ncbi:MAG: glycosyltransferase N-terminal domain-containing protein [Elusimicrobiota bacterium]
MAPIAAVGLVLSFLFSSQRGRLSGLVHELPERLGSIPPSVLTRLGERDVWWFHAASAGEVSGLAPLISTLSRKPEAPAIVVTSTTRSGRDAARALPGVAWAQLAPLDAWPCVSRFINRLVPSRLIVAETEIWPTALILAAKGGLSPALVNARLTAQSLRRYRLISSILAPALRGLTLVAVQTKEDSERFQALGIAPERILVAGNSKYDQTCLPATNSAARARLSDLGWDESPIFVAGSTHLPEEKILLAAFLNARQSLPTLRLVMAPRHLERSDVAALLLTKAGLRLARWSEAGVPGRDALLLDEMGVLSAFYPLSRAAFVGGTLVPVGGHNLLEPALASVPVLFGPYTEHIDRPAKLLEMEGGGYRVQNEEELTAQVIRFCRDEFLSKVIGAQAKATANRLQGASGRLLSALEDLPEGK